MHIGIVSEHASPLAVIGSVDSGGQNVYVAQLAEQLVALGHRVDVFTRRDHELLAPVARVRPGLRVIHVPAGPASFVPKEQLMPHMPAFAARMSRFIDTQRLRYDVLHANFFMSGMVCADVAARHRIAWVITFHALGRVRRLHQGSADGFPDARFDIEARLAARADRVVAECPQDVDDLVALYGADPRRIDTVPCGVDLDDLAPQPRTAARRALGWPDDDFSILQLGRMVPRKGVATVIESLAPLHQQHGIRARLYIAGGATDAPDTAATPEIGRLMDLAHAIGVADRVHFLGRRRRPDLATLYSAADAFVTTPWYEPFGITPLEAMACATPVVGSAVGGIRSTVVDGETGYLVPPRDPQALAERLARLQRDPARAREMGRNGRRRVERGYTWRHVAERMLEVYATALPTPRSTAVPQPAAALLPAGNGAAL